MMEHASIKIEVKHLYYVWIGLLMVILLFISSFSFGQNPAILDSLEKRLPAISDNEKASVLYELVYGYLRVDVKKAKIFVDQSREFAKTISDPKALSYVKLALGIYNNRMGQLDSSVYYLNTARDLAMQSDNHHALVRIYASLGHTYISSAKPEQGLENMFAGLRILDEHPDLEMELKLRTNVAWAYLELKQYRNCIDYGLKNLKRMEGTPFEWIALYTYNNVAVSYGASGDLDSAQYFIHKGISAAQKSNDMQALANGYFILGTIYSNAKKYELAIEQYLKARPYRDKVGNPLFIVSDLYTISELYYKTGEYRKGVQAATEALTMAEKYDLQLKYEGAYVSLAQNYEGLKDFRNASKYYRLWALAKDSVYTNANAQAIADMSTKYETEKKEQQLLVQKAEIAEQDAALEKTYAIIAALVITLLLIVVIFLLLRGRARRQRELFLRDAQIQATIYSQENERRRFARDLHDGMGQLISALRIALHSIDKDSSLVERHTVATKAESLLNDMHNEIRGIAFNLMPQTLVKSGLIPGLKEMATRLTDSTSLVVRVNAFDMPERLSELQEISLYRVIQEWINNVIKHSMATVIEVQLIGYEEEITITIEDNGNGFDPSTLMNSASGNGWKNIMSRVNLIKGMVDVDTNPGRSGTTLIIRVPTPAVSQAIEFKVQPNTR
jgi:two-component system, NarL family, sensor kinase